MLVWFTLVEDPIASMLSGIGTPYIRLKCSGFITGAIPLLYSSWCDSWWPANSIHDPSLAIFAFSFNSKSSFEDKPSGVHFSRNQVVLGNYGSSCWSLITHYIFQMSRTWHYILPTWTINHLNRRSHWILGHMKMFGVNKTISFNFGAPRFKSGRQGSCRSSSSSTSTCLMPGAFTPSSPCLSTAAQHVGYYLDISITFRLTK
jgi:hypothetical protein